MIFVCCGVSRLLRYILSSLLQCINIFQISTNVVLPSESVMSTPFVRIPLALTIVLVKQGTAEMEKHAQVGST